MTDLKNKVVLITGVSSGIGLGAVASFARSGASIVGCSLKPEGDPEVSEFYKVAQAHGNRAHYMQGDVSKKEELERFVSFAAEKHGVIDVVLSNAGANIFEGAEACSEEQWQHNLDLNLTSHWRLSRFAKPYLEKSSHGVILLMTSNHAFSSIPGCFPYNVAKTAILGLVRGLAIEWGPKIRTVGIAPGFINTAGNSTWFNSFPEPYSERERTVNLHPVKKIGTVEEVGDLCVYLASPSASFISGTTILMDGGRSALMQDSI